MSIRRRLRLFFFFTLLFLVGISLYSTYLHRANFEQAGRWMSGLHDILHVSSTVQLRLQAERNAWKGVLQGGTESAKYHAYLAAFFDEERKVRQGIRRLLVTFSDDSEIRTLLERLERSHAVLGRALREAIRSHNASGDDPRLVVDEIAGAMDENPDLLIAQLSEKIEQDHRKKAQKLDEEMREKELLLFGVFIALSLVSAIVFIWLIDRQIGKPAEEAAFLANYDPLTGLPNRTLFQDRLQHAIDRADRNSTKIALLFLDLDHFKTINDVLGHQAGDDLLRQVGGRLRYSIRKSDTPARLGGDEFAVILEGLEDRKEVANVAEHIRETLQHPFEVMGRENHISVSIGITLYPADGKDSSTLLKNADAAMYRAKENGRNNYRFFNPS